MSEADVNFHNSFKPRWTSSNILILADLNISESMDTDIEEPGVAFHTLEEVKEVCFARCGLQVVTDRRLQPSDSLLLQKAHSSIRMKDGLPFASLSRANFPPLIDGIQGDSPENDLERRLWQLTYILFNNEIEDDISAGVPEHLRKQYLYRIKKDRLSLLLEAIIRQNHAAEVENIKSPEERAMAYLCAHRVDEACKTLVESGNPHLATLVSQIGRDETIRKDMKAQIESWRSQNILSEMTEPIRALYELVAGNCLRSEGKPNAAIEDRTSTFTISERFGLDWIQAFGLRLWYGIGENDPIEAAVALYHRDIQHGDEPARPVPMLHGDECQSIDDCHYESPLWVVLKTFAVAMCNGNHPDIPPVRVPDAIMPESVTGHGLHNRLSFQFFHHLCVVTERHNALIVDNHRADQLTLNYAGELTASDDFGPALFVLSHLTRALDRELGIKQILSQFASWLPSPKLQDGTPSIMWKYLTEELRIPDAWVWAAKALYARYEGNWAGEVKCLINAEHWNEAYETFCKIVAPKAVIAHDWKTLKLLIEAFGEHPESKIRGWAQEGGLYEDFLALVNVPGIRKDQIVLKRLVAALISVGEKTEKHSMASFEEKVAFREIGRLVAEWCTNDIGSVSSHIISPLC